MKNHPNLKKIFEMVADHFATADIREWITHIEDPLDYQDPVERQGVIERNLALLQQKMALLRQYSNITPESAAQFVNNGANFNYEESQALEKIRMQLDDYEEAIKLETQVSQLQEALSGSDSIQKEQKQKKERPKRKIPSYRGWIPT